MKHETFVANLAQYYNPTVYVEVGIHECGTFNMVHEKLSSKSLMYGVDIKYNSFETMVKADNVKFHNMTSGDFFKYWEQQVGKEIDMVFIDADHSKESVIKDATNFYNYLRPDYGIMVLHDTWPLNKSQTAPGFSGDCYKAVSVLKKKLTNSEVFTITIPYGLTLIRKMGDNWRNEHLDC